MHLKHEKRSPSVILINVLPNYFGGGKQRVEEAAETF